MINNTACASAHLNLKAPTHPLIFSKKKKTASDTEIKNVYRHASEDLLFPGVFLSLLQTHIFGHTK